MRILKLTFFSSLALFMFCISACNSSSPVSSLPPAPANIESVKALINGAAFSVVKCGFPGAVTVNEQNHPEWIDPVTEQDRIKKEEAEKLQKFSLAFKNDTALVLQKEDKTFDAAYTLDTETGEYDNGQEGIKLRITYADPSFMMGAQPTEVTFTYLVMGAGEKELLLQLPQTINNRNLIALMRK